MAITKQRLVGPRPATDADGILDLVRDLGCLQLDPISTVARTHLLVLWSRLGAYNIEQLDSLLWERRQLFEYWAHCASIVLTEDYPIHSVMMRGYGEGDSPFDTRLREWVEENDQLRQHIIGRLREEGPLLSRQLEKEAVSGWLSTGWTSGRNVSRMLDYLWAKGEIMVAGRVGGQKQWDLAERCLPAWTPRDELSSEEVVRVAAQRSLRALGVARPNHIQQHFIRSRYPGLPKVLAALEAEGRMERVELREDGRAWPGTWYIHSEDIPLLEQLQERDWDLRTTILSPFDNLICDRARTELLFDFRFRIEIYTPKKQRQYGYYVMPILHGDRLVGRIDPEMDRARQCLTVNAVYAEPDADSSRETGQAVARVVEDLAGFLGAREIEYRERVPEGWRSALR